MQTKAEILNYLKTHYHNWDEDNYEFFTELIFDILTQIPLSKLGNAYIDIGQYQRAHKHDIENNIAVLIIEAHHDSDTNDHQIKKALYPYMYEGVDAYNTIHSGDILIITLDMAY